jgi:hypothetical protein
MSDSGIGHYSTHIGEEAETGLDIFSKYSVSDLYTNSAIISHKPSQALQDAGPYIFELGSQNNKDFIMLQSMRLAISFKIVNFDGTDLEDGASVSFCNNIGHSLFCDIAVKLNNTPLNGNCKLYAYKSYIQQMFSFSGAAKATNLNCEYFSVDDHIDNTSINPGGESFKIRMSQAERSNVMSVNIVPLVDFMSTQHFLAPGHTLYMEFERSRDSFALFADMENKYKIKILDLTLTARHLQLKPSLHSNIEKKMKTSSVYYPFTRNTIRSFQIHSGTTHINLYNIWRGQLPRAMYFAFLDNTQIAGSVTKNPYAFLPYNIMEANVIVSGRSYPSEPIKYNFDNDDGLMTAYRWFLDNIGISNSDTDIGITAEQYFANHFLLPFDLSARGDNGLQPHAPSAGELSFSAKLREGCKQPLTILAFGVTENTVEVIYI